MDSFVFCVEMVGKSRKVRETASRIYTINLHKRLHTVSFKKRAPRAIKEIKKFAQQMMGTTDVRVDPGLNKAVWDKGVRNVPYRIRVRLSRKRNEDKHKGAFYTLCQHEQVDSFKGLEMELAADDM